MNSFVCAPLKHRDKMIEEATKGAVAVPMSVVRHCQELLDPLQAVAERGNTNSASDAGVAAHALRAAASGALLNVLINLGGLSDKSFVTRVGDETSSIRRNIDERCDRVAALVEEKIQRQ